MVCSVLRSDSILSVSYMRAGTVCCVILIPQYLQSGHSITYRIPGVVVQTCNPRTREAEARGLQV
jgi:hypothetical protein